MRRASNILLLVGGIYSIICAASFFIVAIVLFVSGTPLLGHFLEPILVEHGVDDPEKVIMIIQICSISLGVTMLFCAGLSIPSAVVAFLARKKPEKGLLIVNIVFGYLIGYYNLAGGILGIIYNKRLARKNAQNKVVDVQ